MCGIDFVPPFQGLKFCCHETQGVALGCPVNALSARGMTGSQFSASAKAPLLLAEIPRRANRADHRGEIRIARTCACGIQPGRNCVNQFNRLMRQHSERPA